MVIAYLGLPIRLRRFVMPLHLSCGYAIWDMRLELEIIGNLVSMD